VFCPLCGYNLRGLTEPRCPECGYQFAWLDLLDPRRREHPFLFEHHPKRPVWSFVKTLAGGLRPKAFWTGLNPRMPSRPLRLALYWVVCMASLALGAAGWFAAAWADQQRSDLGGYRQVFHVSSLPRYSWRSTRDVGLETILRGLLRASAGCALWCLATLLALLIFQASMRRAKVRLIHIVRCVVYSLDLIAWAGPMLLLAGLLDAAFVLSGVWLGPSYLAHAGMLLLLAAPVVACFRLARGYRHYLGFRHAAGVAVAVQVIVVLLAVVLLLNV
jgi:hypothetical protein